MIEPLAIGILDPLRRYELDITFELERPSLSDWLISWVTEREAVLSL